MARYEIFSLFSCFGTLNLQLCGFCSWQPLILNWMRFAPHGTDARRTICWAAGAVKLHSVPCRPSLPGVPATTWSWMPALRAAVPAGPPSVMSYRLRSSSGATVPVCCCTSRQPARSWISCPRPRATPSPSWTTGSARWTTTWKPWRGRTFSKPACSRAAVSLKSVPYQT